MSDVIDHIVKKNQKFWKVLTDQSLQLRGAAHDPRGSPPVTRQPNNGVSKMSTSKNYQSDSSAAIALSAQEREAARQLKENRPEVIPGTRVIPNDRERKAWYNEVVRQGNALGISRNNLKIQAFCDLAGVPD
jgi:orotidine-5'-phosphate decarboxylase